MSRRQDYNKFLYPEQFLSDVLKKSAQGRYLENDEHVSVFYRATVLAVDVEGGKLENHQGDGGVDHVIDGKKVSIKARYGPANPPNSLKARILTNGLDQFTDDKNLRVFWPLFPDHLSVPIKPGEHVYVTFEDVDSRHGLWINKVPGHDGVNEVKGESKYKSDSDGALSQKFPDSKDDSPSADGNDRSAGESQINESRLADKFGDGEG